MPNLPKSESKSQLLALYWGVGVTCVSVLIALSFPEWGVFAVVLCGGAAFTAAFYEHGWFSGWLRTIPMLLLVWVPMTILGYAVFPKVDVVPHIIYFHKTPWSGESYPFAITNNKSSEVFVVSVLIDFGSDISNNFVMTIPDESKKPLKPVREPTDVNLADVLAINCEKTGRFSALEIYHMQPHETRQFFLRHKPATSDDVKLSVYHFSKQSVANFFPSLSDRRSRIVGEVTIPSPSECREVIFDFVEMAPAK